MKNAYNASLELFRAIRADIACVLEDIQEVKQRLSGLEAGIGGFKRDMSDMYTENASQHVRHDCLAARIEKIERRLELQ